MSTLTGGHFVDVAILNEVCGTYEWRHPVTIDWLDKRYEENNRHESVRHFWTEFGLSVQDSIGNEMKLFLLM